MNDLQPSVSAAGLWKSLQQTTQARIATGRSGDALKTAAILNFETAQALARDAVHLAMDVPALAAALTAAGFVAVHMQSNAPDRAAYLRRPDAGRRLSEASRNLLTTLGPAPPDALTIVIGDGLSAAAAGHHAISLVQALQHLDVAISAPIFIATQARVALGDEIAERIQSPAVLVLLGERPGLSTPDSLGAYLTWNPRVGRTDAERNCVSNIHQNGLSYAAAAHKLAALLNQARQLGLTGFQLHDESEDSDPFLSSGPGR